MPEIIVLLRGINVGAHKRLPMADFRKLLEHEGYSRVRTLLNSGNAVVTAGPRTSAAAVARGVEKSIQTKFHFHVPVVAITAEQLDRIIAECPLKQCGEDPSRFLVGFVPDPQTLEPARPLLDQRWAPEILALGASAAYLWHPNQIHDSKLFQAVLKAVGDRITTRNWATCLKLQHLAAQPD